MSLRSVLRLLFIFAFGALSIAAQAREITKEEFIALQNSAYGKLQGATYRVRVTTHPNLKTEIGTLISEVSEHAPDDRLRSVRVWQLSGGGTRKEETLQVGNQEFVRKNDGAWEDVSKGRPDRYTMFGDPVVSTKEIATYRHLGIDPVGDIHAELVEEMLYREEMSGDRKFAYGTVNRLWISKDGRLLKAEWKHSGSDGLVKSTRTSEYEYDPNIKIELPKN